MSNQQILAVECYKKGYSYNGKNVFTFQEWKKRGYSVKKGEKAFLQVPLWKGILKKDKDGNKVNKIIAVKSSLFTIDQVQKLN